MGVIKVENIRVYAYHGCMSEETTIGSDYRVDVSVEADLEKSSVTDALNDTVDYVTLNAIVVEEMRFQQNVGGGCKTNHHTECLKMSHGIRHDCFGFKNQPTIRGRCRKSNDCVE